jgi:hypothetical protein
MLRGRALLPDASALSDASVDGDRAALFQRGGRGVGDPLGAQPVGQVRGRFPAGLDGVDEGADGGLEGVFAAFEQPGCMPSVRTCPAS